MAGGRIRQRLDVSGIVQGVGFRPFVHGLAVRLGLSGMVGNDVDGVFIEVEGDTEAVCRFGTALRREAPPLAVIETVTVRLVPVRGLGSFAIVGSHADGGPAAGGARTLISPDVATCADCLRELFDPADRRFRYPFINCTNCGPRFTIIRDVPYDRPFTTMADFALCPRCAKEYEDPEDRRFHAQPISCPGCGPTLRFTGSPGEEPVAAAAELLRAGQVLAIKGLGGYHLAADATSEKAASALRARKHREAKPFAVMVPDLATAHRLCEIDEAGAALLASSSAPIVLLPRPAGTEIAPSVAPGNHELGLFLPYTPLHHLLIRQTQRPMILTSGNVSDEPICYEDGEALERLAGIADAFLTHDRPIHIRTDDSVVRPLNGRPLLLRRARGYAPRPIRSATAAPRPVLAVGAELKSTFCLVHGHHGFVSQHIGDLENYETLRSFTTGIEHFMRLFAITPEVVAHDLHPEYLSTKYALDLPEVERIAVQHHHAHIAACLADNREEGPVIGVAFDGLGYGADGTLWGGEILIADLRGFVRAGHLAPVPLPGGTAAIKAPWRMAAAYLGPAAPTAVRQRNAVRWASVVAMAESGLNSPLTSSAGRLFDAVSALLGIRDTVSYEGQAAIELEQRADPAVQDGYPVRLSADRPFLLYGSDLIRAAAEDLDKGVPVESIAGRFHNSVATMILLSSVRVREETGLSTVALSGGVFQNRLLLEKLVPLLQDAGFRVLTHHQVPPNDGGISLGQAAVAISRCTLADRSSATAP